ncbi:MAG: imidazole glycerol phosphate synthase subunit HisH [Candidatus Methylomirabilales bacterium]|nr:imidazole glycerol phosphate synthase subunit HisH [candidate division NC10 bacterium]
MIAIIDSGIANLRSVEKGFEKVGVAARVVKEPRLLRDAAGIVLPGVGAFADGIATLKVAGFIEPLMREIESGKAILGICLGLHFLFSESEEFGLHKGLDILRGRVRRFPESVPSPVSGDGTLRLKIPHMGWNQVHLQREVPILKGIPDGSYFYFVHSYFVEPDERGVIAGITEYGVRFTSMIWRDNLFATQFHPEKSQACGLQLLANFGSLAER